MHPVEKFFEDVAPEKPTRTISLSPCFSVYVLPSLWFYAGHRSFLWLCLRLHYPADFVLAVAPLLFSVLDVAPSLSYAEKIVPAHWLVEDIRSPELLNLDV